MIFPYKQLGFTLVELLVVMLVLVALASVTIETTSELAFQGRYEVTKDRYEKIRQAIIGRPDVLINGRPDISGYVTDMGRLPNNIRELLDKDYCLADRRIDDVLGDFNAATYASAQAHCDAVYGAGAWVIQGSNWNGPYLQVSKKVTEANAFPDGWGNLPTAYCSDLSSGEAAACTGSGGAWFTEFQNHNYGWYYAVTGNSVQLLSLGKDQAIGGAGYDADYPGGATVDATNWQVTLGNVTAVVDLGYAGTCNSATCSNPNFATQISCETPRAMWDTVTLCSNSFYTTQAACEQLYGTWSVPVSQANCEVGGAIWSAATGSVCLRIKDKHNVNVISFSSEVKTIPKDGQRHYLTFSSASFSVNFLPMGDIFIGVYIYDGTSCSTSTVLLREVKYRLLPGGADITVN